MFASATLLLLTPIACSKSRSQTPQEKVAEKTLNDELANGLESLAEKDPAERTSDTLTRLISDSFNYNGLSKNEMLAVMGVAPPVEAEPVTGDDPVLAPELEGAGSPLAGEQPPPYVLPPFSKLEFSQTKQVAADDYSIEVSGEVAPHEGEEDLPPVTLRGRISMHTKSGPNGLEIVSLRPVDVSLSAGNPLESEFDAIVVGGAEVGPSSEPVVAKPGTAVPVTVGGLDPSQKAAVEFRFDVTVLRSPSGESSGEIQIPPDAPPGEYYLGIVVVTLGPRPARRLEGDVYVYDGPSVPRDQTVRYLTIPIKVAP